jgi:hypothetical protein
MNRPPVLCLYVRYCLVLPFLSANFALTRYSCLNKAERLLIPVFLKKL